MGSSQGRSSTNNLHNASPLTYLMRDTKVVDSEKIREPVLRSKYQKRGKLGGFKKQAAGQNMSKFTTSNSNSAQVSNQVSTTSLKRERSIKSQFKKFQTPS